MIAPVPCESPRFRTVTGPAVRPGGLTLTREAADRCGLRQSCRVLDIGCGSGATVASLTMERKLRAVGVDRSRIMIQEGVRAYPGLPLMLGEAEWLPFSDGRFDAVFMECVLSLIVQPETVLKECRRMLKPWGHLIVSDIYARNPAFLPAAPTPIRSCLGGAVSESRARERVMEAGLVPRYWEDRSELLKQLAGQIVFTYGSLMAFWSAFCTEISAGNPAEAIRNIRPGYYLLIAQKTEHGYG